ncbi:hypothetical protein [Sporosarcina pasteurii]|uniref:Uncharacterized protein n=1 Tax=Sporosarcina pasteurii TaxID=1474 RepID=A0A380BCR1_SPOPA|nr:hypothetical protein [Sporosarcina pasteurii]MDS9472253.1 hypothetical protein [Sporosarcina pasteurii]SUI99126.1 Uncharacterised protein [Sporosarcina pasteurii]
MHRINKEILRMELQISELIRMVANLNERLRELEDVQERRMYLKMHRSFDKVR